MNLTIETGQGHVTGQYLSVDACLSDKKCANFNAIPFAKYKQFQKAEPVDKWEGTLDGTGYF